MVGSIKESLPDVAEDSQFATASQVALNPLRVTLKSLWKTTVIVFPWLMMGVGLLDPQYFCSPDPKEIETQSHLQEGWASRSKLSKVSFILCPGATARFQV